MMDRHIRGFDGTDEVVQERVVHERPVVQEQVVRERLVEPDLVAVDDVVAQRSIVGTPSMVLTMLVAAALIVLGIIVMLRGDMSGSWTEPVDVSGLAHTMLLGAIDIGVGAVLLLLAFGSAGGRIAGGVLLAIGGAVIWFANADVREDLAAQWGFGAALLAAGALIVVLALVEGDRSRVHSRRVDRMVQRVG
jgi:hypothetical protein